MGKNHCGKTRISNLVKSTEWVQNTAGKGEIAHYGQFLLFSQCFQKTSNADT